MDTAEKKSVIHKAALCTPGATDRAQRLYDYLDDIGGKNILLAQQETPVRGKHEQEMEYLLKVTGKLPAIRGLDYIHDDYEGVNKRAIRWNERGGIVTICWHTGVEGIGYQECKEETPDFEKLLISGTAENGLLLRRWDNTARALLKLQEEDIPILWRPFHEFDGGWFWWGKNGGEWFVRLWREMYRIFTQDYGLKNLIWVLGYADDVLDGWYPGDEYCDVIGSDTYRGVTTNAESYRRCQRLFGDKPLAFHECGIFPEPDQFFDEDAVWSWVMPWHSKWLMEDNPPALLQRIYTDDRMLTLDQIPVI